MMFASINFFFPAGHVYLSLGLKSTPWIRAKTNRGRDGSLNLFRRKLSWCIFFHKVCFHFLSISSRGIPFSWCGCYGLSLRHKLTEFAHSFCSVLVSVSVFMALSTVFHSTNSPDISPLSHSVLLVFLFLPYWSFQLYISLWKSSSALIIIILCGWLGLKHQLTN